MNSFRCHYNKPLLSLVVAVLWIGNHNGSADAFSLQQPPTLAPPTPQDEAAEQLFLQQGISMGDVKLRTTPDSVAGRGLFLDSRATPKPVGTLLSFIPASNCLELVPSRYPDLYTQLERAGPLLEWPMRLAACAQRSLEEDADATTTHWAQNINSWRYNVPESLAKAPEAYGEEELQSLAALARSTPEKVRGILGVRWNDFQRQSELLGQVRGENDSPLPGRDLYEGVLSRAISLTEFDKETGAVKGQRHCVVPFHDMVNHANPRGSNNVGLFTMQAVRRMAPDPRALPRDFEVDLEQALDEDLCLVALQPLPPGTELFTSYTRSEEPLTEEGRVWKLLQYGFPLDNV